MPSTYSYIDIRFQPQASYSFLQTMQPLKYPIRDSGAAVFSMAFDLETGQLDMIKTSSVENYPNTFTEGVFSSSVKSDIYLFWTSVNLKEVPDTYNDYQEKVVLGNMSGIEQHATSDQRFLRAYDVLAPFFNKIENDLFNPDNRNFTLEELKNSPQKSVQRALQQKPFLLDENYENAIPKFDYATMSQNITDILIRPSGVTPVYMDMVKTLHQQMNDDEKYESAKVTYYTDAFGWYDNPFQDFITNLREPDSDPEKTFYKLATDLQNCL